MGGKRSPIRSTAPRWRPGRYKQRARSRVRRERPFRPVEDTLIAIGASLVAAVTVICLALPMAATYRIPVFLSFGVIMASLTAITFRLGGKGQAGRVMAGIMLGMCILLSGLLFLARDQLNFEPHDHDHSTAAAKVDQP